MYNDGISVADALALRNSGNNYEYCKFFLLFPYRRAT